MRKRLVPRRPQRRRLQISARWAKAPAGGRPVVMTFHDYWLFCNQGQLLRTDGSICTEAITGSCTDCAGLWLGMGTSARGALHVLERWWPEIRYRTSGLRRLAHRYLRLVQRRPSQRARMQERMRLRREEMRRFGTSVGLGIVPSRTLRDQLVAFGLPAERLMVVPYGIPTRPLAGIKKTGGGTLRVAYLGRIIPAKGVHVLLEAAERLRRAQIQIDLHGDIPPYGDIDDYAKRMRRRAASNPGVRWHGAYDHDALSGILAEADVVVVPSIWYENQPFVMLEAFASGTPVVATDLGGMRELVQDGRNGLLFPRGDAQALAQCLEQLADDRPLLERLREGIGPVTGIETHARALESVYEGLLAHQQSPVHAVA